VFEKIELVEKMIKLLFLRPILTHSSILLRTAVDVEIEVITGKEQEADWGQHLSRRSG